MLYESIAPTFSHNLRPPIVTVGIPVTLASGATVGSRWQRIHSSELIRAPMRNGKPGESKKVLETARGERAQTVALERIIELTIDATETGRYT